MKGKLIVFDGSDAAGKQTQARLLLMAIQGMGKTVLPISFPRYTETFYGKILYRALQGEFGDFVNLPPKVASLLYAGDRHESAEDMVANLDAGHHVVCDRFSTANQIHQGGKISDPQERERFLEWLDELEHKLMGIPRPDAAIYLDVPPRLSEELMTGKTRDIVEKNPNYLENSHESAQWLIKRHPEQWIHIRCAPDGKTLRTREDIHEEVVQTLKKFGVV